VPELSQVDRRELDRSLVRGLAWTGGIKWTTQILTWASTLIVARILTPEDYGIVSLATVYYGFLLLISEFGVGAGVLVMRDLTDEQLAELNTLAVLVGIGGFLLACVVAIPAGRFFHSPQFPLVLVVMSASFVISSFQSVPVALLKKELRFKLLSSIDGLRAVILAVLSIVFAVMGLKYWTLVLAAVASALLATAMTLSQRRYRFSWPRFRELKTQIRFSRHIVVTNLAWAFYSNADFIVAGRKLGQAALGAYTLAWSFANAPLEKITSLIGSVTPAYFSAVQNDDAALRRYLLKPTEAIAFLTFPTMIGMALVTRDAVLLVLGAKWQPVIVPMQILCLYVCFRSIMTLLPQVLTVKQDTRFVMYNALVSVVILPLSFFVGSRWGTRGIALAWVMAYPINAVPFYLRTAKKIGLRFSEYYNALRPAIEGSVLMAIGVCAVKWIVRANTAPALRLGAEFVMGVATYAGFQLLLYRERLGMFKRAAQMIRT